MASKYDNNSTARMPLIESVIIIAIFAIVSVTIMKLYMKADDLQQKSVMVSKATIMAENMTEAIKGGAYELVSDTRLEYDREGKPAAAGEGDLIMEVKITGGEEGIAGSLTDFSVEVFSKKNEKLASIYTSKYSPKW